MKYQKNLKTSLNYSLLSSLTPKLKILSMLPKQQLNFSRSALILVKTRICLKYCVSAWKNAMLKREAFIIMKLPIKIKFLVVSRSYPKHGIGFVESSLQAGFKVYVNKQPIISLPFK